jgi:SDR family mycofactocin-dependent oxidoreductase
VGALEGKVAFITGAARGQGRSHAVRLAEEGADIIAVDICAQIPGVAIPMARPEDLEETAALVEKTGRRIHWQLADVRDQDSLAAAVDAGVAELGRLDIALANAGVWSIQPEEPEDREGRRQIWDANIGVNLTGVWNTIEVAAPHIKRGQRGGSIVITSSSSAIKTIANNTVAMAAYSAAKVGVLGLLRVAASDLAEDWIRVNAVLPGAIDTPMSNNEVTEVYYEKYAAFLSKIGNALPIRRMGPEEISNAILFLVSDAGRYITGVSLPVEAGVALR